MEDLLFALCDGDMALVNCWITVLREIGVASVPEMLQMGDDQLQLLRNSHHEHMAEVLALWQVASAVLKEGKQEHMQTKADLAVNRLLAYANSDSWRHISGDSSSLDDVQVSYFADREKNRFFRASSHFRGSVEAIATHLLSSRDQSATDECLFSWIDQAGGCQYQIRRQRFPLIDPLVDREALVVSVHQQNSEGTVWAMASVSVEVDHLLFATSENFVRAQIGLDGFVVKSAGNGITQVTRVSNFDACGELGDQSTFLGLFNPVLKGEKRVEESLRELRKNGGKFQRTKAAALTAGVMGATAGAAAAPAVAATTISGLGFGTTGIVASSTAAGMMSTAAIAEGGAIAAGSSVAVLQAAGATGSIAALGVCPIVAIVLGGAAVGGGIFAGTYFLGKHIKKKLEEKQHTERVRTNELHLCGVCDKTSNRASYFRKSCL